MKVRLATNIVVNHFSVGHEVFNNCKNLKIH